MIGLIMGAVSGFEGCPSHEVKFALWYTNALLAIPFRVLSETDSLNFRHIERFFLTSFEDGGLETFLIIDSIIYSIQKNKRRENRENSPI